MLTCVPIHLVCRILVCIAKLWSLQALPAMAGGPVKPAETCCCRVSGDPMTKLFNYGKMKDLNFDGFWYGYETPLI